MGHPLSHLKKRARAVAFSTNGTTLATGGFDGTVRLWNVAPSVISQQLEKQDIVRIVYFLPKGSRPQLNIRSKIDKMIRKIQHFYAEEIESHRLDRKSFVFETDQERKGTGLPHSRETHSRSLFGEYPDKSWEGIEKYFDLSRNVYFLVVELDSQRIDDNVCGQGRVNPIWSGGEVWQTKTGLACIPTFKNCFNWQTAAHELGHAFGLKHDFRDDDYLMSYGKTPDRLSQAAAHWLSQTRFFKPDQPFFDKPATIEMFHASPPTQFKITDANGIHQVQLHIVPTDAVPPSGYEVSRNKERNQRSWEEFKTDGEFMLQSYYRVNGESQTTIDLPVSELSISESISSICMKYHMAKIQSRPKMINRRSTSFSPTRKESHVKENRYLSSQFRPRHLMDTQTLLIEFATLMFLTNSLLLSA